MKRNWIHWLLALALCVCLCASFAVPADAAEAPTGFWVEPSDTNGIPVRIDVFKSRIKTGGSTWNPTYADVYQIFLPGSADPDECFLFWDGDSLATMDGVSYYASGECPVPAPDTEAAPNADVVCTFVDGDRTLASINVVTYQGSAGVTPVFIEIDESDGKPTIAEMDGDPEHEVTCSGTINIGGNWYEMPKIKGRGNATWEDADDKRPYNVTLDSKISFPGVDSEPTKKWSFLAELLDHSLLGNRTGYYLAHEIGIGQDTASADVWMNGEYQGCYTVTPKTDSFVSKNGYLIEEDNYLEKPVAEGGDPQFELEGLNRASTTWSSCYNIITVKKMGDNLLKVNGEVDESPENLEAVAQNVLRPWLQEAWDAIRTVPGGTVYNDAPYTDYIDLESFAKMYLMHEYIKSYDVCAGSIYFHRDGTGDGDKLYAGPLWDLDNAMGSTYQNSSLGKADDRRNGDRRSGEGSFIANVTEYKTSVYKTLGKHTGEDVSEADFLAEVTRQYNLNKAAFDGLPGVLDGLIGEIADSARMDHMKVNELSKNNHKYSRQTTLGSGEYAQTYLATTDSKTDWANYAANLKTYVVTRSLWLRNTYTTPPPVIAEDPEDYTGPAGSTAEFTAAAEGTGLTYLWYVSADGGVHWTEAEDDGHDAPVLSVSVTNDVDGYRYYCHVTSAEGSSADSEQAVLFVSPKLLCQPEDCTVPAGDTAVFTVIAEGGGLSYQWYVSTDGGSVWTECEDEGNDTPALGVPVTLALDGYRYYCRVTDAGGNIADSDAAVLHVASMIICQPQDISDAIIGETVQFAVEAAGDGLTYQWYVSTNGGETWKASNSAGNKTAVLRVPVAAVRNGYRYYCRITDGSGRSEDSEPAALTLAFGIVTQPKDFSGTVGASAIFRTTAVGAGLSYQWYVSTDGGETWKTSNSTGNKTAILRIPVAASRNGYRYYCHVADGSGRTADTDAVTLTVTLSIVKQPTDVTGAAGTTAVFRTSATGAGLSYQWHVSTDGGETWKASGSAGNQTANLRVPIAVYRDGYRYFCQITDGSGRTADTDAVTLTVALSIVKQPTDISRAVGTTAVFRTSATGVGLSYQWFVSTDGGETWNASNSAGNKTANLRVPVAAVRNGYRYYCRITDGSGRTADTDAATLTVALSIVRQPTDVAAAVGTTAVFRTFATGVDLHYQWYVSTDGGETWKASGSACNQTANLRVPVAAVRNGYRYYCRVSDGNGAAADTGTAALIVTDAPDAPAQTVEFSE